MATTDPRVLIPLLEDTQQNLNRVTNDCMASQEKALLTQRNLNEHFVRFQQRTWGLGEQVDRDSKAAASTLQAVEAAQGRASETYDKANRIRAKALQILNKSERTQKHWESEVNRACCRLEKAEDWVRKAEQRFANAKQWVTVATERVRPIDHDHTDAPRHGGLQAILHRRLKRVVPTADVDEVDDERLDPRQLRRRRPEARGGVAVEAVGPTRRIRRRGVRHRL